MRSIVIYSALICTTFMHASLQLTQAHIDRQDSYEYEDDIQICALQQATLNGITIPEDDFSDILYDATEYARRKGKYTEDDDGTRRYSLQTVFRYIKRQFAYYEKPVDTQVRGDTTILMQLPCHHVFHEPCIRGWIKEQDQAKCPVCRSSFTQDEIQQNKTALDDICPVCLEPYTPKKEQPKRRKSRSPERTSRIKRVTTHQTSDD